MVATQHVLLRSSLILLLFCSTVFSSNLLSQTQLISLEDVQDILNKTKDTSDISKLGEIEGTVFNYVEVTPLSMIFGKTVVPPEYLNLERPDHFITFDTLTDDKAHMIPWEARTVVAKVFMRDSVEFCRTALFGIPYTSGDSALVFSKIDSLKGTLTSPEDWDNLPHPSDQRPGSSMKGDIGWIPVENLDPFFGQVVQSIDDKEIAIYNFVSPAVRMAYLVYRQEVKYVNRVHLIVGAPN